MIFHRLLQRIRRKMLPTEQEKMFLKWNADGGDQALRFDYDLTPDSLVLDLGGYEGQWASDIFARYLCHVVVFEPATEFAANIRYRFRCNPKISVCSFGLGAVSRTETLYLSADGSSTFTKDGPTETIQIVDVAAWANQENIQAVALMKINIEGGEYELLKRLIETDLINMIDNIQVQFHQIGPDSAAQMAAIQKSLQQTHMPVYQYPFIWENWKRK